MSCIKCRRITNYPQQSCYGIVTAADTIRELKVFIIYHPRCLSSRNCRYFPLYSCFVLKHMQCALGNRNFVDILKVIRLRYKMVCDAEGCGKTNSVQHISSRCPPIFTIGKVLTPMIVMFFLYSYHIFMLVFCGFATSVLEWENSATENEISETTKAFDWEIDISRLYEEGLAPNTKYRLVSMVKHLKQGHICLCYCSFVFLSYSVRISGM